MRAREGLRGAMEGLRGDRKVSWRWFGQICRCIRGVGRGLMIIRPSFCPTGRTKWYLINSLIFSKLD